MLKPVRSVRRRLGLALTATAVLGVAATYLLSPLNGNIRYEAGVKAVGTFSAAGTFSHRPLAFRMLMDGVFGLAHTLSVGIASFELVVRILVAGLTIGAGVLLARGLRAYGVRQPGLHAVVVAGAILLMGPINTGEPDWMAVVLAAAGVGAALLGGRRSWWWIGLAGVLFVAAAGMKIVTLPVSLLGLAVVALLDRRLLVRVLASSVVVGLLYVLISVIWVPYEVQWLLDIRTVQKDALANLSDAWPFFAELVARRPALALVPAALVLAGRRERWLTLLAVAVGVGLVVGQGQYFYYHATTLVVVAAVAVFRALRGHLSRVTGMCVLGIVLAASALTAVDIRWVSHHQRVWGGLTVAVAVAAVGWAFSIRTRAPIRAQVRPLAATLATLALLYPGATPWAARLLRPTDGDETRPITTLQSRSRDEATARRVRQVVGGPDVPVTYLTFGEWTYFIGNPTDCRYPSALFLQRTRNTLKVMDTPSYRENLACLSATGSRWLIWDPTWFALSRAPAQVQEAVAAEWNCVDAVVVNELRLCPRRR